jgi:hypothetical protein
MKGPWKVTSQVIGDRKKYAVYRLIDINEVDHSGNREFAGEYIDDRHIAESVATSLNQMDEEKSPLRAD